MVLFGVNVPPPPDQIPPDAVDTEPFRVAEGEEAQMLWSAPAFTNGAFVIVTAIASLNAMHPSVDVSVSVILPAVVSALLGV